MPSDTNKRLYCRVEGNPPPTISWLKDGMPLRNAEGEYIVTGFPTYKTRLWDLFVTGEAN